LSEKEHAREKAESVLGYRGVTDIEKEYHRLLELVAIEVKKPHNVGGEIIVGTVKDHWKHIIGLIFNPGFKLEN